MKDPVHRSAPVRRIIHNPYGKTNALMVRISPGAFSWNHGFALVLKTVPQANASRQPADIELNRTFSSRIFPFWTPAFVTARKTSTGDRESCPIIAECCDDLETRSDSCCRWYVQRLIRSKLKRKSDHGQDSLRIACEILLTSTGASTM